MGGFGLRLGPSSVEGHEVKWNPRTEKIQEPRGAQDFFFFSPVPSHLFTRGNGDVTLFTFGGQWWLEESNRSRGAVGEEGEEGREGLLRGLKKLSVLFTMDTMFWPLRLQHNNTCGFKFLPSPYSLSPSFNSVPASLSYIIWLRLKDMNFPSIETSL